MRAFSFVLVVLLSTPMATQAQVIPEFRPFVGAFVPMADQRDVLDDAVCLGTQLAVEAADRLHVVGTFGFAGPNFAPGIANRGHMHVYLYDVGAELFRDVAMRREWRFRPFMGAGLGGRTYDPTFAGGSKSYPAGYAALGGELQLDRVAVRFEARDYFSRFKGIGGDEGASTRTDLVLSVGFAYHLR